MIIKGKVWKYGDDINTDVIYPGRYTYQLLSPEEMASHSMEDLDKDFIKKVGKGDIIVAGKNFGMGSSREQAAKCLKYSGITAIIAKSFSRIYFRNAINAGLLAITLPEHVDEIKEGDVIEINLEERKLITPKGEFEIPQFPKEVIEILNDGGLIEHTKKIIRDGG